MATSRNTMRNTTKTLGRSRDIVLSVLIAGLRSLRTHQPFPKSRRTRRVTLASPGQRGMPEATRNQRRIHSYNRNVPGGGDDASTVCPIKLRGNATAGQLRMYDYVSEIGRRCIRPLVRGKKRLNRLYGYNQGIGASSRRQAHVTAGCQRGRSVGKCVPLDANNERCSDSTPSLERRI